jgi:hypothetical protein
LLPGAGIALSSVSHPLILNSHARVRASSTKSVRGLSVKPGFA